MRLKSAFFKGYNDQIDNLRTRRKENAEQFRDFIRFKKEMGEEAQPEELERMASSLGGGDLYFSSALPTASELRNQTAVRLKELAADTRQDEAQNAMQTTEAERKIFEGAVGQLANRETNDEGLESAIQTTLQNQGYGSLFDKFGSNGAWKLTHNKVRSEAINSYVNSTGFKQLTSKEAQEVAIASSPDWMRLPLQNMAKQILQQHENTLVQTAMTAVQGQIADIITSSGGDVEAAKRLAVERLVAASENKASEDDKAQMRDLVESNFNVVSSGAIATAIGSMTPTEKELIAASRDPEKMRDLARTYLQKEQMPFTEADVDEAVRNLQNQVGSAVYTYNEEKIGAAIEGLNSIPQTTLDDLDSEQARLDFVERIFEEAKIITAGLSEDEIKDIKTRLYSALVPRVNSANLLEDETKNAAFNTKINEEGGSVMSYLKRPAMANRKEGWLAAVNDVREEVGLPRFDENNAEHKKEIDRLWKSAENKIRRFMSDHFTKRSAELLAQANSSTKAELETQDADMSAFASGYDDATKNVLQKMTADFHIPTAKRMHLAKAVNVYIETMGWDINDLVGAEGAVNLQQVMDAMQSQLMLGKKQGASAVALQSLLDTEDLIDPNQTFDEWLNKELKEAQAVGQAGVANIQALPENATQDQIDAAMKQWTDVLGDMWEQGWKLDSEQDTIKYSLNNFSSAKMEERLHTNGTQKQVGLIKAAVPSAPPSYFLTTTDIDGNKVYFVADDNKSIADALAYRKDGKQVHETTDDLGRTVFYKKDKDGKWVTVPFEMVNPPQDMSAYINPEDPYSDPSLGGA